MKTDIPEGWYIAEIDGKERMCYKFNHKGDDCVNIFYRHRLRWDYLSNLKEGHIGITFTPIAIRKLNDNLIIYINEDYQ